jgi:hypothetical protein
MADGTDAPGTVPGASLPGWLSGRFPASLVDAAALERDRRGESYPQAIYDGRISSDDATADYRAWCAIHDWLATGRLPGWFHPDECSWASMETAAAKALATIDAKIASEQAFAARPRGKADDKRQPLTKPQFAELESRRVCLFAIHHGVARAREWLEETNRQLRDQAEAHCAAEAA